MGGFLGFQAVWKSLFQKALRHHTLYRLPNQTLRACLVKFSSRTQNPRLNQPKTHWWHVGPKIFEAEKNQLFLSGQLVIPSILFFSSVLKKAQNHQLIWRNILKIKTTSSSPPEFFPPPSIILIGFAFLIGICICEGLTHFQSFFQRLPIWEWRVSQSGICIQNILLMEEDPAPVDR